MDSSDFTLRTGPFPICLVSFLLHVLPCFIEIAISSANSVDPDQTPRSAASDLGLHCLSMSHLLDAEHKLVKYRINVQALNISIWKYTINNIITRKKSVPSRHLTFMQCRINVHATS